MSLYHLNKNPKSFSWSVRFSTGFPLRIDTIHLFPTTHFSLLETCQVLSFSQCTSPSLFSKSFAWLLFSFLSLFFNFYSIFEVLFLAELFRVSSVYNSRSFPFILPETTSVKLLFPTTS